MSRISKSLLMFGTGVLALGACASDKGPGAIGTKADIVVNNFGLPGQHNDMPPPPGSSQTGPTSETTTASPPADSPAAAPPAVEAAAPTLAASPTPTGAAPSTAPLSDPVLPNNSPVVKQAEAAHDAAQAPVSSIVATPARPSALGTPIDTVAPTTPVTSAPVPPSSPIVGAGVPDVSSASTPSSVSTATAVPSVPTSQPQAPIPPATAVPTPIAPAQSTVYPSTDYKTATPAPSASAPVASAPVATPPVAASALVAGTAYHMADPNAPYSPKAAAAAAGIVATPSDSIPAQTATASQTSASSFQLNMTDPSVVRSAQKALIAKGAYAGPASGMVDSGFLNALSMYQGQNKLPQNGLNQETLRSLGVIE